ncbi:hypothetical protein WMY93_002627 [Mugilogobius chulae]|uniref:RBR-type E3 ubiquitin transferase n=1 Tax=Mugilogobius chulae TaxID=88201 RepID=A0AAW0Q071_9GOBI
MSSVECQREPPAYPPFHAIDVFIFFLVLQIVFDSCFSRAIFDSEEFVRNETKFSGEFRLDVELPAHFTVSLKQDDALSQYEISSLPPLCLTFDLPENYPSCSPPNFTLSCSWLTPKELSSLTAQLKDLYQAAGGEVVLFSWAQFLKYETLNFLGITDVLEILSNRDTTENNKSTNLEISADNDLTLEENKSNTASSTSEAASSGGASNVARLEAEIPLSLTSGQVLMSQLLIHDAAQKEKAWLGSDCVQLIDCGHIFCRTCLAEFCKVQIESGNVRDVTCAQTDCKSAPTPAQVRSLVGEELFSRYDRLLLQSTLDSMHDVVYCPRPSCASAVLSDSSTSMALCTACSFAFCVLCNKTYHGTEACYSEEPVEQRVEKEDYAELPTTQEGRFRLWQDYIAGSKERQKVLTNRYSRRKMRLFLKSFSVDEWVKANCKSCPHCFTSIEKNGGCNHMTCSRCRQHFCWNCLAKSPLSDHISNCC